MAIMCQGCGAHLDTWNGKCPQCGGTEKFDLKPRTDPMIGKLVGGRYKITRKLGQGGMGAVYQAEHTGVGQRVAIKFLNPNFSGDPDVVRRFLNEARSYGAITHPHAVQLHDFGQDEEGNLYISMEFIEGIDLKRTLEAEQRLKLTDALDIALQIADVLGYAHSKGIVHRDLKPENVMLVKGLRGYHAKVLDFGVARLMAEQTRVTAAGSICGTPRYMSPEQAEGGDIDHRSDIYALGLVLFECLTGVHPFTAPSIAEVLRKQVLEPMPHLEDVAPELRLPSGIDNIIQKAVAKNRDQRWSTMEEFAKALVALVPTSTLVAAEGLNSAQTMIKGPPEKTSYQGSPYAPSRPVRSKLALLAGGGALAAAAIGAVLWLKGRPAQDGLASINPIPSTPAIPLKAPEPPPAAAPAPPAIPADPPAAAPSAAEAQTPPRPAPAQVAAPAPAVAPAPAAVPAVAASKAPSPAAPAAARQSRSAAGREGLESYSGVYAQAHSRFVAGELRVAFEQLKDIPEQSDVHPRAAALSREISELTGLLKQADELKQQGRCAEAIRLYEQVLKRNEAIASAAQGLARCKKELPAQEIGD